MTLTRRRFLTISAASAGVFGTSAQAHSWQGRAFGADISLTIQGPREVAHAALAEARDLITDVENLFSLFDPASALSRLNTTGVLPDPDPRFLDLMKAADDIVVLSSGLFDPTVQPLWTALANRLAFDRALAAIGWDRVQVSPREIRLAPSQALTFNGIAQGYATDIVTNALTAHGLTRTLVNIGEYRGTGGPWTLGLSDPDHGRLGQRTLFNGAIATSSPAATPLGAHGHILHPSARPVWSTVSVEASSATVADGLSTALVLADRDQIEDIRAKVDTTRITLVDFDGNLTTL